MKTFRRILIAVEPGPLASATVRTGLALARSAKAKVKLMHVVDPAPYIEVTIDIMAPDGIPPPKELISRAKRRAAKFLAGLGRSGRRAASVAEVVTTGDPVGQITKLAAEWPADLIVIGSRGRKGLERLFLGSVAEKVMRQTPCAVLVVRERHVR